IIAFDCIHGLHDVSDEEQDGGEKDKSRPGAPEVLAPKVCPPLVHVDTRTVIDVVVLQVITHAAQLTPPVLVHILGEAVEE
uniref:Uncharacterized protein n=1 Tax=Triticum urartu TaxID=4572 RepID=A0A8R7TQH1_TRIUA